MIVSKVREKIYLKKRVKKTDVTSDMNTYKIHKTTIVNATHNQNNKSLPNL